MKNSFLRLERLSKELDDRNMSLSFRITNLNGTIKGIQNFYSIGSYHNNKHFGCYGYTLEEVLEKLEFVLVRI